MIYLDYNASAPLRPEAKAAVLSALDQTGNASSVHGFGRSARKLIEAAREEVAALVKVKPAQVIFTSGGTEANNFAMAATGRKTIAVSTTEHDSVLASVAHPTRIPVGKTGLVDEAILLRLLKGHSPALVSVMMVNNETGVIQPIAKLAEQARLGGALLHTDAVQAAGKLDVNFQDLGVDLMTISAHKLGGPQGAGALIVREGVVLHPTMKGGGQEMRRRAGTENVAAIAGFGAAAHAAKNDVSRMGEFAQWRDAMETKLLERAPEAEIISRDAPRVATVSCIAMKGISSEKQVVAFDLDGIAVSAGAACSSGKVKPSHVLTAMGYAKEIAGSTIRLSFGYATQQVQLDAFVDAWVDIHERFAAKNSVKQAA